MNQAVVLALAVVPALAVAPLVSCQQLMPYGSADAAVPVTDGAAGDVVVDLQSVDTAPGPCPVPPTVQATCDPSGQCVECEPVALGRCECQCLGRAGDRDCDGIPDVRDPWPARCNKALHEASFLESGGGWQLDERCRSCGWLSFGTCVARATLPVEVVAPLPTKVLVELRFWPVVGFSELLLRHAHEGGDFRACKALRESGGYRPELELAVGDVASKGAGELAAFSEAPPEGLILQVWFDGEQSACRVVDPGASHPVDPAVHRHEPPSPGRSLGLDGAGAAFIDYVRIYAVD